MYTTVAFSCAVCLSVAIIFLIHKLGISGIAATHSIGWRSAPQPQTLPIVGNLLVLDIKRPIMSMLGLSHQFRDCFRLDLPGVSLLVVNTQRLVNQVCNEKIFRKEPLGPLLEARAGAGDGLFTAYTDEENWGIAHRILMPRLGPAAVRDMLDEMLDVTLQLVDKWSGVGPAVAFDPTGDLNKLTLDTIALCALDLRLESFTNDEIHSFAPAMTFFLDESGRRAMRPSLLSRYLFPGKTSKYWRCRDILHQTANEAIAKRKASPTDKEDIMNAMLYAKDPKTGQSMTPRSVVYNTLTLLGAGFETTAGMLGFLLVLLMKHPRCMELARQEVAETLGAETIGQEQLAQLPYITACIRETLRLYPNAPGFQVKLRPDAGHAGSDGLGEERYMVRGSDVVTVNLLALHRDEAVYGADAGDFKPERMLANTFKSLPRNSWKPFGNGVRSCIGQWFAIQEAQIVVATLLQRFDLSLADPNFEIQLGGEALTLQPHGVQIIVRQRRR